MPTVPGYTDTVARILTDRLGPDALTEVRTARRPLEPGPDPIRTALAHHLHTTARQASRHERDLREHMRRLQDFLTRAQDDLTVARTPSRWEVIGTSGTAIDQAVARFDEAIERLDADTALYTEISQHLPTATSDVAHP